MFHTKLFDTKYMVMVDPRIIRVVDFMSARTNISLKNFSEMQDHIRDIVTEYYQERYTQVLYANNGREPKKL